MDVVIEFLIVSGWVGFVGGLWCVLVKVFYCLGWEVCRGFLFQVFFVLCGVVVVVVLCFSLYFVLQFYGLLLVVVGLYEIEIVFWLVGFIM